ncbi:MAG: putative S-layer protein [Nanoarchaeota archaeon]
MKSKYLLFGAIFGLVVLLTSLGSASITGTITSPSGPINVSHNSDVSILFSISNGAGDPAVTVSNFIGEVTAGSGIFKSFSPVGVVLLPGETKTFTAILNVPRHSGGVINAKIKAKSATGTDLIEINVPAITINKDSTITLAKTQDLTRTQNGAVNISNTGNIKITDITVSSSGDFDVSFTPSEKFELNPGESKTISVSSSDLNDLKFGDNKVIIKAGGKESTRDVFSNESTLSVLGSFCNAGAKGGNLSINDVEIDNQGEGSDDEWNLLDIIDVNVEVENKGNVDVDNVVVEIGLFDSSGVNQVNDLDFENVDEEEIEVGDLRDGEDDSITFRFRVPADIEDGGYRIVVKAFGDDVGESNECTDKFDSKTFEDINIERESDEGKFIAFEEMVVTPSELTCGDTASLTLDVFNIGDEDQDQVKVNLLSTELKVEEFIEIKNDLDSGDKETINFDFVVPQNVQDKTYQLRLNADYDYSRGDYRESSEGDTLVAVKVIGCSPVTGGGEGRISAINAVLDSDAKAGSEIVVRGSVTNVGSERASFIISALDYDSWASLDSISERILQLNPGESKDVRFTFNANEDAEGENSFVIEVRAGDKIETREVSVDIEGGIPTSGGVTGLAGLDLGDNGLIWVIGIVNVILIILIIVVAVKVSRR